MLYVHSDHPSFTRSETARRASKTVPRPCCESDGPEYTQTQPGSCQELSSNELPEGHRFILSTTQVNKERNCTCWCSPAFPAASQRETCGLPLTVPEGWSITKTQTEHPLPTPLPPAEHYVCQAGSQTSLGRLLHASRSCVCGSKTMFRHAHACAQLWSRY